MTKDRKDNNDDVMVTRRTLLQGAGVLATTGLVLGCGDSVEFEELDEGFRDAECEGGTALSSDELLAPINHIVVLMMENRSFDHMFGSLSLLEGREDVDGLRGGETNPGPNGEPVESFRLDPTRKLHHLPHKWEPMHQAFNNGAMDGFVRAHHDANKHETDNAGPEVMGFLTREDMPVLYALADNYTLCDRWFCSVMGPTWPNRFFLHAASSGGRKTNHPKPFLRSIWDVLDDGDKRGINYFSDLPWAAGAMARLSGFARLKSFFQHAEEGSLPDFSIIDPGFFMSTSDHPREFGGDSDHPEMGPNVALGQLFIATLYQALANSPSWNETMLVITYDESGGFFDHVPPPTTVDDDPEFTQLGFRVPGLIIGPHVRRGCVNNNVFDHTSVIATATNKFGLETINQRVAAASDLSSAINPEFLGAPQPPIQLPQVAVPTDLIEKFTSVNTQPELGIAADYGDIPAHLDLRPEMLGNLRELVGKAHDFGLVKPVLRVRDR